MPDYKKEIAKSLAKAARVDEESAGRSLAMPKGGQADLCSTIAFEIAKKKKENPAAICAQIISSGAWPPFISKVEAAGPYLNFYFSKKFWAGMIGKCAKGSFGKLRGKKRAIVEFPSVNPNKPWHVGHLRNAILGDCIANLLSYRGYDAKRIDYIDDLGLQVAQSFWASKNLPPPRGMENSKYAFKADHVCGWQYVEAAKLAKDESVNSQVRSLLKEMEEGKSQNAIAAREFAQGIVKAQY
jgi:arginyl-tRNA synthetase